MEPEDSLQFGSQISSLYDSFMSLVDSEKQSLEQEKHKLLKDQESFQIQKSEKLVQLEELKQTVARSVTKKLGSTKIIDLNIGGTCRISTSLSTLLKFPESALSQLISSDSLPLYKGEVFIDRESEAFLDLLSYLRTGKFPQSSIPEIETRLTSELDFWGIPYEEPEILYDSSLKQFDPHWCASILKLESNNTLIKKLSSPHGIAFGLIPLTQIAPYIEFHVQITSGISTGSHIFIGLVDKSKYHSSQLLSTRWRDAQCSLYWDVWNSKLIRTDENGVHSVVSGYGCSCDDDETNLGIHYEYKTKTVSFYKKGICQGTAFSNVNSGLHPSVDIWFDSGVCSINQTALPRGKPYM